MTASLPAGLNIPDGPSSPAATLRSWLLYRAVQPGPVRYLRTLVGQDDDDIADEAEAHLIGDAVP